MFSEDIIIARKTACEDFEILVNKCKSVDALVKKYVDVDNNFMLQQFTGDIFSLEYAIKMRDLLRSLLVNELIADNGYKMCSMGDLSMWVNE